MYYQIAPITIFLLFSGIMPAFTQSAPEKVIYIVDSIRLQAEPGTIPAYGTIQESDIFRIATITNKDSMRAWGINDAEKLIYIETIAFVNRPDSLRTRPNLWRMEQKGLKWYDKDSSAPYTGPFTEYYLNGRLFLTGSLRNGLREGRSIAYFPDGKPRRITTYKSGMPDGEELEFHPNGQLKVRRRMNMGRVTGLLERWYSTGEERDAIWFNGMPERTKRQQKKLDAMNEGIILMRRKPDAAIRQFTRAIRHDSRNVELYYHRGRTYLDIMKYDKAISDLNRAIELEPFYHEAIALRAMTRIQKYESGSAQKLSGNNETDSKKALLPGDIRSLVCEDLRKSIQLGYTHTPVLDAAKKYCR